ncbi:MAG TPA: hypothetical protein VMZ25_08810 [Terriglobales bacterium]|nr:hypothetical protein [Terriglobales bacterium]
MRAKLFPTRAIGAILIAGLSFSTFAQGQTPAGQKPLDNQSTVPQQVSPGPLEPQPTPQQPSEEDKKLPNAPSSTTQPSTVVLGPDGKPVAGSQTQQAPATTPGSTQPLGTAAAEKATTAGGAASRPAGSAIAPVKQRQVRSFLIKLGMIAAGGVALGTVYALSKGSPSKPPGAVQ